MDHSCGTSGSNGWCCPPNADVCGSGCCDNTGVYAYCSFGVCMEICGKTGCYPDQACCNDTACYEIGEQTCCAGYSNICKTSAPENQVCCGGGCCTKTQDCIEDACRDHCGSTGAACAADETCVEGELFSKYCCGKGGTACGFGPCCYGTKVCGSTTEGGAKSCMDPCGTSGSACASGLTCCGDACIDAAVTSCCDDTTGSTCDIAGGFVCCGGGTSCCDTKAGQSCEFLTDTCVDPAGTPVPTSEVTPATTPLVSGSPIPITPAPGVTMPAGSPAPTPNP